MSRTVAAAAVLATLALAGCSGSNTSSDKPPSAPSRTGSGFNAAGYLYGLDADKHSHRQIDSLLAKLEARCTDDVGVLTTAATNTATDVTDAKDTQSTRPGNSGCGSAVVGAGGVPGPAVAGGKTAEGPPLTGRTLAAGP
ncbi:hypothetical protein ACFWBS_53385 [Streptomyces mirabilis]|uniref:hypothetical protein n=1 Tax=Streptomyces mirabilis TaxID=68239 RepID=UPI00364F7822